MKTAVTRTSLSAYDALRSAAFHGQHALILGHMKAGRLYSRREIAKDLKLETSTVSGRVNELIEEGQIVVCGSIKCPITGRNVEAVKLVEQQVELFAQ